MGNRGQLPRAEHLKEIDKRLETGPLAKIRLKFSTPDDEWFADKLRGVIGAGPGIDVFYASAGFYSDRTKPSGDRPKPGLAVRQGPALFIMKKKGELRRFWEKPGIPSRFVEACFDGRYAWFVTEDARKPSALFVLDPVTEDVYEVTAEDGLPQGTRGHRGGPIAPHGDFAENHAH